MAREQQDQAHTSLQEGFAYIQSLTQLEIRLRNYDGIGTVRAEDNSNTASPNITFKKAVSKGVKLGNTKERRTRYITNVSDSKAEHEDIDTSRPRKTRRTFRNITAQRQNEKQCGERLFGSHTSTKQDVSPLSKRSPNALWPLHARKTKIDVGSTRKQTYNLAPCGHGVTGAGATEAHPISFF